MIVDASHRMLRINSQGGELGGAMSESTYKETVGIRNKDSSKCT
jgi:hypothetical protein